MKHIRILLLSTLLTLMPHTASFAAAFQFYELGTPINGTAAVGQAVVTHDASISYYNPAGMTALSSTQLMIGIQPELSYTNFSPNASNTISGNNGSNAGGFVPGIGGFYVYQHSPKLSLGVSLTAPYGGSLSYDNHWVGRYVVQQMLLYTLNLNPSIAYQINEWAAVGGGIAIEYANLYQTVAIPISPTVDGQATVKASNTAPGFNLGLRLTPNQRTKVGIAYRSQIVHHLSGNASFLNISTTPNANTKLVMPANLIASLSQTINQHWTLLGEAGWAHWSTMHDTVLTIDGYSAVTPNNWIDTYRLGVGGQYTFNGKTALQAGVSFDSSPTSASKRLPDLPMDRQIRVGLGLLHDISKAVHLGLAYEYLNLGNASISNTSSAGVLAGSYSRNFVNIVQASLSVNC